MELLISYSYIVWHETTRNAPTTGGAPPTGYPVIENGQDSVGHSPLARSLEELHCTMARRIQAQWFEGAPPQTHSGTSLSAVCPTEDRADPTAFGRSTSCGVHNGPLDLETSCASHLETVSHSISSQPLVATFGTTGMELSKTRTTRQAEGRGSNRQVDREGLASHKKKPQDLAPISYSWMKAGFCSSPMCDAHGLQKVRRPTFTIGSSRTESLPLEPSRFLHTGGTWDFTFNSVLEASSMLTSLASCSICSNTSEERSSSCGIEELFTAIIPSDPSLMLIQDCIQSFFQNMLPSSTPRNISGTGRISRSQIASPTVRHTFTVNCTPSPVNYDILSNLSGHAFTQANCLGGDDMLFHYLCEAQ